MFESIAPFIPQMGSYFRIGVDGISLPLVFLNSFLTFLVVLISWKFELRAAAVLHAGAVPRDSRDGCLRLARPLRLLPLLGA